MTRVGNGNATSKISKARFYVVCYTRPVITPSPLSLTLPVSQFTLLASTKKGNKPDFHKSASAEQAKELYDHFFAKVQSLYNEDKVKNGVFQAMMDVGLINDGPVGLGPIGLDYCSVDEQVNTQFAPLAVSAQSHHPIFTDSPRSPFK